MLCGGRSWKSSKTSAAGRLRRGYSSSKKLRVNTDGAWRYAGVSSGRVSRRRGEIRETARRR
jgi:hypothetical protein